MVCKQGAQRGERAGHGETGRWGDIPGGEEEMPKELAVDRAGDV